MDEQKTKISREFLEGFAEAQRQCQVYEQTPKPWMEPSNPYPLNTDHWLGFEEGMDEFAEK